MRRSLFVLLICAGCHFASDPRTAVELERDANAKRMNAEAARANVTTQQNVQPTPYSYERDMITGFWGYYGIQEGRVGYEEKTASELEESAQKIRKDADIACQRVPASTRRSCPLGAIAKVSPIPRGVRLDPATPQAAETWRAEVTCAVAQARVQRPNEADQCPLFIPGAESRVVDTPNGPYIEITVPDEARAGEVVRRAQALVGR